MTCRVLGKTSVAATGMFAWRLVRVAGSSNGNLVQFSTSIPHVTVEPPVEELITAVIVVPATEAPAITIEAAALATSDTVVAIGSAARAGITDVTGVAPPEKGQPERERERERGGVKQV